MSKDIGYLVIYTQKGKRIAGAYDGLLNYQGEFDPESAHTANLMQDADHIESLDDEMWDDVLGELTPDERRGARAYKLEAQDGAA